MTTVRRVLELSPEEIRRISENAVATVAAQKIVTKGVIVDASIKGTVISKSSSRKLHRTGMRLALRDQKEKPAKGKVMPISKSGWVNRANSLAESVLSQSNTKKSLQAAFNNVVKNLKK